MGKEEKKSTLTGRKRKSYFNVGYICKIWKIQGYWKIDIFEMQALDKVYIATTLQVMNGNWKSCSRGFPLNAGTWKTAGLIPVCVQ